MRPIRMSAALAVAVLAVTACNAEKPPASGPSQQPSPSATFSSPTVANRPAAQPTTSPPAKLDPNSRPS
jgi:hypothetical protein